MHSLHHNTQILTSLEKRVIDYIIADNEELPLQDNPADTLADCMRAIEGGFSSDMKFTLHLQTRNKLILYIHDTRINGAWDERNSFYEYCGRIKKQLVCIADCINYLAQDDYVRVLYKPAIGREVLSDTDMRHWRRYEQFTPDELESLAYACSIQVVPKLKLYKTLELVPHQAVS
jgi:hypothetical protein